MTGSDEEVLEKWFLLRNIKTPTQEPYMVAMNQYMKLTGKTPSELLKDAKKENLSKIELVDRRVTLYLLKFKKKLQEEGKAPKTLNLYFSAIKSFYRAFNILIPDIKLDSGDIGLEQNMGRPLTRKHLRKLISAASTRERALIYLMAMSGMAQQEARDLKIKKILESASAAIDIELETVFDLFKHEDLVLKEILTLEFVREKVKYQQHTFLAPEVTRELISYLKERCYGPNEKIRIQNNNEPIFVSNHGTTMSRDSVVTNFRRLGIKAGFKKDKGAYSFWRSHALRKYFTSTIINKTGEKIIADYLAGHKISPQDRTYWQANVNDLKNHYLKAFPYLSIDGASMKDYETEEFREIKEENEALTEKLQNQEEEIAQLHNQINSVKDDTQKSFKELLENLNPSDPNSIAKLLPILSSSAFEDKNIVKTQYRKNTD